LTSGAVVREGSLEFNQIPGSRPQSRDDATATSPGAEGLELFERIRVAYGIEQ
jgi:hypothetical protein